MQTPNKERHTLGKKGRDGGKIEIQGRRNVLMTSQREDNVHKEENGRRQRKLPELKPGQ